MSRRARHPVEEMRQLFIDTTAGLVVESGLNGVSAREVSRRLGYVAGSLYNVFPDLDALLVAVQEQMLQRLSACLDDAGRTASASERLTHLARTYLRFAAENPRLWNLLSEHALRPDRTPPPSFEQCLAQLIAAFESAAADSGYAGTHSGRAVWASTHGLATLMTSPKITMVTSSEAEALLEQLLGTQSPSCQPRLRA